LTGQPHSVPSFFSGDDFHSTPERHKALDRLDSADGIGRADAILTARPHWARVNLPTLFLNSFPMAGGSAVAAVLVGFFAAYAFSRKVSRPRGVDAGRPRGPSADRCLARTPIRHVEPHHHRGLRNSLLGVGLALLSTLLPFAIWNLNRKTGVLL
jgi:ABC-type glycerol-3-phosphate transport system permease component